MLEFVNFVIIVFGILQIILFFKIWSMTNNVKEIKNKVVKNNYLTSIVLDDKKGIKEYLGKKYTDKVLEIASNQSLSSSQKDKELAKAAERFTAIAKSMQVDIDFKENSAGLLKRVKVFMDYLGD